MSKDKPLSEKRAVLRPMALVCTGLVFLLGLLVIVGWGIGEKRLLQIYPTWVPMQFNTALGFVLIGLSGLLIAYGRTDLSRISAGLAGLLGLLTLIEYLFVVDLGIDQLFVEHHIVVKTSHPGRMAPNTALCFLIASFGVVLLARLEHWKQWHIVATVLSALTFALATAALIGYASGLEYSYGWGSLTRMAAHTAVGFILVGVALFFYLESVEREKTNSAQYLFPLWLAIGVPPIVFSLWVALSAYIHENDLVAAQNKLNSRVWSVEKRLEAKRNALQRMAIRWEHQTVSQSRLDAQSYLMDMTGLLAVVRFAKSGSVKASFWQSEVASKKQALLRWMKSELHPMQIVEQESWQGTPKNLLDRTGVIAWISRVGSGNESERMVALVDFGRIMRTYLKSEEFQIVSLVPEKRGEGSFFIEALELPTTQLRSQLQLGAHRWVLTVLPAQRLLENTSNLPNLMLLMGIFLAVLSVALAVQSQRTQYLKDQFKEKAYQEEVLKKRAVVIAEKAEAARVALKEKGEELFRSNRELEHFAYSASHDLQEPLRKISSFAQLLEEDYKGKLSVEADEYIHYIVDGADRMSQLIQDILAYSRLGQTADLNDWIDLKKMTETVLSDLRQELDLAKATIEYNDLPSVRGNKRLLQQLIQNLVSNAIKYRSEKKPIIELSGEKKGNKWRICVRDNGIGIDPKFNEQVFVLFKRLHSKEKYPGTGIGLTLCRRIVEQHGGTIWVEPGRDGGSSFYFTLAERNHSEKRNDDGSRTNSRIVG